MIKESFYTPPLLVTPPTLRIEGDELNHLVNVMRMRVGEAIRVVDGGGNAYDAVITGISRTAALCSVTAHHAMQHEPSREVVLGVGVLKNPSRFDFLVEKTVELGVRTIVPLFTDRTIPRPEKADRWQKLCLAAMKQSGRCVLPTVRTPMPFDRFITSASPGSQKIIAHEKGAGRTPVGPAGFKSQFVICIGPEGGFSDDEVRAACEEGFEPVSLGPRRLRTETAAIVAVAAILVE